MNLADGDVLLLFCRDKEVGRVDLVAFKACQPMEIDGIELFNLLDFVVPPRHAEHVFGIGHENIDVVALHAEIATRRLHIVAHVERTDELSQKLVAVEPLPSTNGDDALLHGRGSSHAIDARHARHDDHVFPPRQQRRHCREPQTVDFVVDGKVFLDIRVGRWQIGLGLVVVVVADVVFHGVVREETLHFLVELRRQRLVVTEDERGLPGAGNHVGHGESLARTRHAEQHLRAVAPTDSVGKFLDGFGLVASRLIIGNEFEIHNFLCKITKKYLNTLLFQG